MFRKVKQNSFPRVFHSKKRTHSQIKGSFNVLLLWVFLLIMYHAKRFKTVEEAVKYFDTLNSDDSDILDVDVHIIPQNESIVITENEDIKDVDLGEIISRDVTGELEILHIDES
ncbi:hypothetical protein NPIL_549471 [Nephila pilipes]|uniref:Uncharacterized protein n=1 Tax=Nephila pilipes TaxID=299642 RepID=A0A8X6NV58_NEPPI|nr:hypothetical protein NPIL_549471 [Nephila pilipes]